MTKLVLFTLSVPGLGFLLSTWAQETLPSPAGLILPLVIITVLVLVNGFFVAAEFAIIGVRPSRVEEMVEEGISQATYVQAVLTSPVQQDRYIATAQLGITIASLGLGMYGEPQIAHFIEPYLAQLVGVEPTPVIIHTIASIIGLGLLTYLHVVVGEMVPKSLSLSAADKSALLVSKPMHYSQVLLGFPVHLLNLMGNALLRFFRVPMTTGHARLHSPEELELIVSESADGGLLKAEEEEMILNIFGFSGRQVGQVMTPRRKVEAIPSNLPLDELLKSVAHSSHSRFPVYENDLDHIIGIMHLKDLVRQRLRTKGNFDIRLILRPAPYVPENMPVEKLLTAFKRQRIHMGIVVDEFGGTAGVVTLEDLVEEIVGEVQDEFDSELEPLVEVESGVLEVAGNYLVEDLQDYIFLGEEDDLPDVDTVGGLIVTWLGRPPHKGDEYTHHEHIHFSVLEVDGLAVARVKITFPAPKEGNGKAA